MKTERLIIREFTKDDFNAVHQYSCDLDTIKFMMWGPNKKEDTIWFLEEAIRRANEVPRMNYDFAVVEKKSKLVIGAIGLYIDWIRNLGEIGYILHKNYWKQGYGTELAKEMIHFGFEQLKLHRIYATCDENNIGSANVLEKCHMRQEGFFKQNRLVHNEWHDERLYAILRKDWLILEGKNTQ